MCRNEQWSHFHPQAMALPLESNDDLIGNQWVGIHAIWGMSPLGRFLPVEILAPERLLVGGSGHSKMV